MKFFSWLKRVFLTLIVRITPRCTDMTRLISQSMDVRLPLLTRYRMRLHYLICVWCSRYQRQLQFMRDHVHEFDGHPPITSPVRSLSAAARDRIRQAIHTGR